MPSFYWIKLYHEILDDPKMGKLPDWLWRRTIELFLLAGENGNDGVLPPVEDMLWRLHLDNEMTLRESLQRLAEIGVVHELSPDQWVVTHFRERQEPVSSTERVQRFRKRERDRNDTFQKMKRNETTISVSSSDSESESESESAIFNPITPAQTAHAVEVFNQNGAVRSCEHLYQGVTGQISIPSISQGQALTDLQTILDHYGRNLERAVEEGKGIFATWCNTVGKNGRNYSPTNTAWLGKWLERIAPVPAEGNTAGSIAERIRQDVIAAGKARVQ